MAGLPKPELEALRSGRPLTDAKLEALRTFTYAMVEKRGWASPEQVAQFLAAGFSKAQVLEVIVGIAYKTLSNYTNHVVHTPLDHAFESFAWKPTRAAKESVSS